MYSDSAPPAESEVKGNENAISDLTGWGHPPSYTPPCLAISITYQRIQMSCTSHKCNYVYFADAQEAWSPRRLRYEVYSVNTVHVDWYCTVCAYQCVMQRCMNTERAGASLIAIEY